MRRVIEASLGKVPATSARRLTSLFRRSIGLVLYSFLRGWLENACSDLRRYRFASRSYMGRHVLDRIKV